MAERAENSSIMRGKIAEIWLHGSSEAEIVTWLQTSKWLGTGFFYSRAETAETASLPHGRATE